MRKKIKTIYESFDVFDINFIKSHEELNYYAESYKSNVIIILYGIILHFKDVMIRLFFSNYGYKKIRRTDFSFFAHTTNQIKTLKPIKNNINSSFLFTQNELPIGKIYINSLLFIPRILRMYSETKGYLKYAIANNINSYCLSFSGFLHSLKINEIIKPKICVVANDHGYLTRGLFRAAEKMNIKSAYIQHASVTIYFPPLEYDYAFLDGIESFEKYIFNKKCKSIVFLSGSARFDYKKENKIATVNNKITTIGIALNVHDSGIRIIDFLTKIASLNKYNIILRPHPGTKYKIWKNVAKKYNCLFSNPRAEHPLDFIEKLEILIAGESSIHLDAAVYNKTSYYYNFSNDNTSDHYGYIKQGLVKDITDFSIEKILNIFSDKKRINKELIKYYVANYDTPYFGKSAELIANTLQLLIENNSIDNYWGKKERNGIIYYDLKY